MKNAIDNITAAIVRPPRARYSKIDLGPARIRSKGTEYNRNDFEIYNDRGILIRGSLWSLAHPEKEQSKCCIVYLHPNSGSRVDVVRTRVMSVAAQAKCNVCGFDFSGCGESGGEYVSLGVREKEDLCAVLVYLLKCGCSRFLLWGRSMGAATAAMFYGAYRDLACRIVVGMVLDSPFTSFQGLATEYSHGRMQIPRLIVGPAVHLLRRTVRKKCDFDILQVNPMSAAPLCKVPTVVLSGDIDKIVPPSLSEEIYDALGGTKIRILFEGGHNTQRPSVIYEVVRDLAIAAFSNLSPEEIVDRATAVLRDASERKEANVEEVTVRRGDEKIAEQQAYKLAAEAEAALKNLLREKDMEALTEEDITNALGDSLEQRSDKTKGDKDSGGEARGDVKGEMKSNGTTTSGSAKSSKGGKDAQPPAAARTARPTTTHTNKITTPSGVSKTETNLLVDRGGGGGGGGGGDPSGSSGSGEDYPRGGSVRLRPTQPKSPPLLRRTSSNHRNSANESKQEAAPKHIAIRHFSADIGPPVESYPGRPPPLPPGTTTATASCSSPTTSTMPRRHSSSSPLKRFGSSSSIFTTSTSTASTSTASTSTASTTWQGLTSFFFGQHALSVEERAVRDLSPGVPSVWALLASAIAFSESLQTICEQAISMLLYVGVHLEERVPKNKLMKMTPEQRSFLLAALAAEAGAELGLSSAEETAQSWGGLLEQRYSIDGIGGGGDGQSGLGHWVVEEVEEESGGAVRSLVAASPRRSVSLKTLPLPKSTGTEGGGGESGSSNGKQHQHPPTTGASHKANTSTKSYPKEDK